MQTPTVCLAPHVLVQEQGGAAMVQLAADVVAELPKPLRQTFTIVACSNDASSLPALAAGTRVVSLAQCVAAGDDLEGCLMVAGPLTEQLDDVMRLLAYWCGDAGRRAWVQAAQGVACWQRFQAFLQG